MPKNPPSSHIDPIRSETLRKVAAPLVKGEVSGSDVHPEGVLSWREQQFAAMGFASYVAEFLATTKIDLHQMEDLLTKGCPHEFACRILMGTHFLGDDERWQWTEEMEYLESDDRELTTEPALG